MASPFIKFDPVKDQDWDLWRSLPNTHRPTYENIMLCDLEALLDNLMQPQRQSLFLEFVPVLERELDYFNLKPSYLDMIKHHWTSREAAFKFVELFAPAEQYVPLFAEKDFLGQLDVPNLLRWAHLTEYEEFIKFISVGLFNPLIRLEDPQYPVVPMKRLVNVMIQRWPSLVSKVQVSIDLYKIIYRIFAKNDQLWAILGQSNAVEIIRLPWLDHFHYFTANEWRHLTSDYIPYLMESLSDQQLIPILLEITRHYESPFGGRQIMAPFDRDFVPEYRRESLTRQFLCRLRGNHDDELFEKTLFALLAINVVAEFLHYQPILKRIFALNLEDALSLASLATFDYPSSPDDTAIVSKLANRLLLHKEQINDGWLQVFNSLPPNWLHQLIPNQLMPGISLFDEQDEPLALFPSHPEVLGQLFHYGASYLLTQQSPKRLSHWLNTLESTASRWFDLQEFFHSLDEISVEIFESIVKFLQGNNSRLQALSDSEYEQLLAKAYHFWQKGQSTILHSLQIDYARLSEGLGACIAQSLSN